MAKNTEQTIRGYAKISEIPLKQVLEDLRNAGFSCNADNVLDQKMRMELLTCFRFRNQQKKQERVKHAEKTVARIQEEIDELGRQISEAIEKTDNQVKAKNNMWGVFKQVFDSQRKDEVKPKPEYLKKQKEIKLKEKNEAIKYAIELKRQIEDEAKAEELKQKKEADEVLKGLKKAETEELKRQKETEAEVLKRLKKTEADKFKQQKEVEKLERLVKITESEARKIGQLLDLCCELIPAPIVQKIIVDCQKQIFKKTKAIPTKCTSNNEALSNIFLNSLYKELTAYVHTNDISPVITIPKWIIDDYGVIQDMAWLSIEEHNNYINNHKKNNRYTVALIETIYFLLANEQIKRFIIERNSPFKELNSIGELLIDIGAIDRALRLYNIDERVFNSPNRLSLLANKAVQTGNLNDSIKLVGKLIKQERYHPIIPNLQAEIKRLEQRHRLKTTFSIDFSKVDELSGVEFENLLMDKFAAMGFKVECTPRTGDFGADLIVENSEGSRIIVQCKRFKSKLNLKAVQEVIGAMGHYAGDMGVVITNNTFLNSAVKLAESHDIELWDGDKLVSFLAGDLSFSQIFS